MHDGRGGDRGGDDVVGRRRDAHPQDQGGDHREEQREEQIPAGDFHEAVGHLEADPRQGDDADDDPRRGAGHGDAHRPPGARLEGGDDVPGTHPGRLRDHPRHDGETQADERGIGGCVPFDQDVDDRDQRDEQMTPLLAGPPRI